jgi:S1-C subfamily serine protease
MGVVHKVLSEPHISVRTFKRGDIMTEPVRDVLPEFSNHLASLVETVSQSIVEIRSHERTIASGFVWRPGLVVTAEEVLGEASAISVALEGQVFTAQLAGHDPSTGIALLRVQGLTAPALGLALELAPKTGELVLAAGRREQGVSARLGIVALAGGPWRSMRGGHIDHLIRLDLTLDRRSEGGPAINSAGRAFGMVLRGPRRSVLVIPAATVERIAARLLEQGSIRPGYLGLGMHPVRIKTSGNEPHHGLIVLGVAAGGPGEVAGIMQGDIVTAWNGQPVHGLRGIFRKLGPDAAGQTVELSLIRAGQPVSVRCTVGARPEA